MSKPFKIWVMAVAAVLGGFTLAALVLPQSYRLGAICDVADCLLMASGAASFIPLALRSRGRTRLFWSLIIFGLTLWLGYLLTWAYYEIVLRRDVPDLFAGDIVLFLDIVPLMAALALRPQAPEDEYAARLGRLDFVLLLVWWLYLYVLIVIPWQYVEANVDAYNRNLGLVYLVEKSAFLAGLLACWVMSKGRWRKLYASLFGMMLSYVASSTLANWAITRGVYYTGSFYDIPLALAIGWLTLIGLGTKAEEPQADTREVSTVYGVWVARCGMIALFSLPLFAAWSMSNVAVPPSIRKFRLALTLVVAFVMGVMVFFRQRRLDRELIHLIKHSQEAFDNLKRLQAQILQSEKLASIGQLVGGAAHELNNPITAMLGYSDLLLSTKLTADQEPLATKIGQHVRRTKSLVASLISFARQAPKAPLDLNTLARTAVKLTQPQWQTAKAEVLTQFDPELPKVLGDSNQLLQVCMQLVGNCLYVLGESGGGALTVSTQHQAGTSLLLIATQPAASRHTAQSSIDTAASVEDSLGLSACQGILQAHHGRISHEQGANGAMLLRVELPITESAPAKSKQSKEPTVPVLWQSRPFA